MIKTTTTITVIIISATYLYLIIRKKISRADKKGNLNPEDFRNDRWDYTTAMRDSENPNVINSLKLVGKKICSKPFLRWILTEPPASLCLFAMRPIDLEKEASEVSYEFWKFMDEPGANLLLTEAAHRGYLPAMSLLASRYDNIGDSAKAEFWQKVGVANLNPSSLLLRGLNLIIKCNGNKNSKIYEQGTKLIIISYMLGEKRACEIIGFENLKTSHEFNAYTNENLLKTIYEIENTDESKVLNFLETAKSITANNHTRVADCIDLIREINEILDNPNVTIFEISTLTGIRRTIVDTIFDQSCDNPEFLRTFEEAELLWRYRLIGPSINYVSEVIIPMVLD